MSAILSQQIQRAVNRINAAVARLEALEAAPPADQDAEVRADLPALTLAVQRAEQQVALAAAVTVPTVSGSGGGGGGGGGGGLPAWVPAAGFLLDLTSDDGTNDTMSDVAPSGMSGSLANAIIAWNSGVVIQENGTYGKLYFTGGGHSDYNGNEVYEYDLATRKWSRIWGPSSGLTGPGNPDPFDAYDQYADGAPGAPHTYDCFVAVPPSETYPKGLLVLAGRAYAGWDASSSTGYAAVFDLDTLTWSRSTNDSSDIGAATGTAIYDPVRNCIWRFGVNSPTSQARKLDLSTMTWSAIQYITESGGPYIGYDIVSGWCGLHNVIVQRSTYSSENTVRVFDPATLQRVVATTTGTGPTGNDQTGMEWCPANGKFYCYKPGASSAWTLTPPASLPMSGTWTWALETFDAGSDAPNFTASSNGESASNYRHNRWRWVDALECFAWYDTTTDYVQLYKPAGL